MELRDYVRSLRARWWLLLVGLLLGASVGLALSRAETPQYTTGAKLFVSATPSTDLGSVAAGGQFVQQSVKSYASLLTGPDLAQAVIAQLHLDMSPTELSQKIVATVEPDTVIIDVSVTDDSPERALSITQAVSAQFSDMVKKLQTPAGHTASPVSVTVVGSPQLPTAPSSPHPKRTATLGGMVGLMLGAAVAVIRDRADTRVKDGEVAAGLAEAPLIGTIPRDRRHADSPLIDRSSSRPSAEGIRLIRTNLRFLNLDRPPRVIVVTSSVADEGKSFVAANLALTLAQGGTHVVLVEADLHRPDAAARFGVRGGVGLTDVLSDTADIEAALRPAGEDSLVILGAGRTPAARDELLSSARMEQLLHRLAKDYEVVVVDSPPVLRAADTVALAPLSDGVVLCTAWGATRRDQIVAARKTLGRVGSTVLGVAMTGAPADAVLSARGARGGTHMANASRRRWPWRRHPQNRS